MSLVPLLFSDWWEDLQQPHRLLDQDFGLTLRPEQLLSPTARLQRKLLPFYCYQPWAAPFGGNVGGGGGVSTVQPDKDKFQVVLDVQQFEPHEIDVKVVDKCVVVTAKHEEKRDEHGWISRQFVRKYIIPEQCDIEQVSSKLSSDGVLTITAPRKDRPKVENERTIKIEHTGKPAIQSKPAKKEADKAKEK